MKQKIYVQNNMGQLVEVSPDQLSSLISSDSSGIGGSEAFGGLGSWNNNLVQAQLRSNAKAKQVI